MQTGELVGPLDEAALVTVALGTLTRGPRQNRMMAALWDEASTLRVARREPYATSRSRFFHCTFDRRLALSGENPASPAERADAKTREPAGLREQRLPSWICETNVGHGRTPA